MSRKMLLVLAFFAVALTTFKTEASPTMLPGMKEQTKSSECSRCPSNCSGYTSCDFAKFCAFQCGLSYLDGDGDGIPCEWTACKSVFPRPDRDRR